MTRRLWWGLAAAATYAAVALVFAGNGPVLPLYDTGPLPSEPYRWVDPPPELAAGNLAPEGTKQEVALTEDAGSVASSIVTPDGQAALVLRQGSFGPKLGEIAVMVDIQPADPERIDEPPASTGYDGNAYVITATYAKDGSTATLLNPGTVVLRSPLGGTRLLRHQPGTGWVSVGEETPIAASLQVFGETTQLGTFVVGLTIHGKPFPTLPVSLGATAVAVAAAGYVARRSRSKKRPQSRRERRAAAQGKPAGPKAPSRTASRKKGR
jgi:hypothetical protein